MSGLRSAGYEDTDDGPKSPKEGNPTGLDALKSRSTYPPLWRRG
jgi:hypothetical protein